MTFSKDIIRNDEKAIFQLRSLYGKYGYSQYKMSKFEEYDLYVRNKDFLVSDSIITFNDTDGKLMALKPDVTLSIVKNLKEGALSKVCYSENVYRVSEANHSFKEIMQTGLECIGNIDDYNICEVVMLAAQSLEAIGEEYVLDISHMGIVSAMLEEMNLSGSVKKAIIKCVAQKNTDEIKEICAQEGANGDSIVKLVSLYGDGDKVIEGLKAISVSDEMNESIKQLEVVNRFLKENNIKNINFDFSIVNNLSYYSGIVFKGYIKGIYTGVLSGGEYSKLLEKMGKKAGAIGFAVYLDSLERLTKSTKKYDVDTVIMYDDGVEVSGLYKTIKMLTDTSLSVMAVKNPVDIKYRQLLKFNGKGVEIVEIND